MNRALAVCLLVACGALSGCFLNQSTCSPDTCSGGCCDATGTCVRLTSNTACGNTGLSCMACSATEVCLGGSCINSSGNGGNGGSGGSGGSGGAGGGGGGGGGNVSTGPCGGSLQLCGSACVDTQSDENNCGFCGQNCTGGKVCNRGNCALLPSDCTVSGSCPPGYGCDPSTKACTVGCQVTSDCPLGATCSNHQCSCPTAQHVCGQTCSSNASPMSCGSSCTTCAAPANSAPTCSSGTCGFACNSGYLACGSACVPCAVPANATGTCGSGSSCTVQCNSGFQMCGGACAACPAGASSYSCSGSTCVAATCPSGGKVCNGACATCPSGASATACQGSACVATACPAGMNLCGGACKAATDITACGPSCAVCSASSGRTAVCNQGLCDSRCTGTTTCKGQCGATCSWTPHTSSTQASFVDVFVDAQGTTHAASVKSFIPHYHAVSGGSLTTESASTTNDCFLDSGGYSVDSAPIIIADPAAAKPGLACPRGNTMNGYRWNASGSAWGASSIFSSTSLNSAVGSLAQSNGLGGFTRYVPSTYSTDAYMQLLKVDTNGWNMGTLEVAPYSTSISGLSLLKTVPSGERIAYRAQTVSNYTAIDAGSIRVGTADAGVFTFASLPWVVTEQFAQEPDGTVVGFDRNLDEVRWVGGAWQFVSTPMTPSGAVTSLHVLVDPAGIIRVAWGDSAGIFVASQIGGTWIVERVSSATGWNVRVAVNAAGKMAVVAIVSGGTLTVFD